VYGNTNFPFTKGSNGYWEFDSRDARNSAELRNDPASGYYIDMREHTIQNADKPNEYGFFPLEQYSENTSARVFRNNMFGMRMDIPFALTETGTVLMKDGDRTTEQDIVFNFSGDDDVWIFVDGELMLDIGGIHGANGGSINFKTGEVKYNADYKDILSGKNVSTVTSETLKGLDKTASHTLSIFYLERGLWSSNLKISFNFPVESKLTITNTIDTDSADQKIFGEALSHIGAFDYYLYNQAVTGEPLPVEESEGYFQANMSKVMGDGTGNVAPGVAAEGNITVESGLTGDRDNTYISYKNNMEETPSTDVWTAGSDVVKKRLMHITPKNSTLKDENGVEAAYLYMKIKSTVGTAAGHRLYVGLTYTDGTTWGNTANALSYNGYSNGLIANVWSEVRISLDGAPKDKEIQSIDLAYRTAGTEIRIADIIAYGAIQSSENTGFATDQTKISDYGSIEAAALKPAVRAFFRKYTKNADGTNNSGMVGFVGDVGSFNLADGQSAVFRDKFRFGSYLYLQEAANDDSRVFDTTYTMSEYTGADSNDGYSPIPVSALVPERHDVTTVENDSEVNNLTNVHKRVVFDGRTSIVNGTPVQPNTDKLPALNKNEDGKNTFVYRNYRDPDTVEGTGVNLKIDYVNTLKSGSVTVKKVLQWTENDVSGLSWADYKKVFLNEEDPDKNESVTFRFTFTNIAGRFLEINLDHAVTADLEVKLTECDDENHTITGEATLEGIPAGTEYKIEEMQVGGLCLTGITDPVLSTTDEKLQHTNYGVSGTGNTSYAFGRAYESDAAFTFENQFVKQMDIKAVKSWDESVTDKLPAGENPKEVMLKLQRKITGGAWEDATDGSGNVITATTENYEYTFKELPTVDSSKNRYLYRVVETGVVDEPDAKYVVFYITNPDGSRTIINASVERIYYVQNGVTRELPILPEGKDYNKQTVFEHYNITMKARNRAAEVHSLFEIKEDGSILYTAPETGVAVYDVMFTPKEGYAETDQEQRIQIAVYAYDVKNDIYVLDYGLPAKLADKNYPGQEENSVTGEKILKNGLFANDVYHAVPGDTVTNEIAGIAYVAPQTEGSSTDAQAVTYGMTAGGINGTLAMTQTDGKSTGNTDIVFTPEKFMDAVDTYSYKTIIRAVDKVGVTEDKITAEDGVVMEEQAKVLPANVVYYEDNFNGTGQSDNTDTTKGIVYSGTYPVQIGGQTGVTQSVDQNEAYGHDAAYDDAAGTKPGQTDSLGSSSQMQGAENLKDAGRANFTFTGTGFDVVGRTYDQSAKVMYVVKAADGKVEKIGSVDTSYTTEQKEQLYQLPVISIQGLDYGTYSVELCIASREGKTFYLDGIRIYNPLQDTSYYKKGEANTVTTEIRQMILGDTKLTDQGLVESPENLEAANAKAAIVNYAGNGADDIYDLGSTMTEIPGKETSETSDINDYLVAGPKHEIYLSPGSAVAFLVTPETTIKDVSVQVEAKAVNTGAEKSTYPTLLNVAGTDANTAAIAVNSSTAMYYKLNLANCKKNGDGSRLVILANSSESGSDISLTNLKTKGCTLSYPSNMIRKTPLNEVSTEKDSEIQGAYQSYKTVDLSDKKTAEKVTVAGARFATNYVRQNKTGYVNITLENGKGTYRPQLYYYNSAGQIVPLRIASTPELTDGTVDPETLFPVRSYEAQDGNQYDVFKVRVKFPADIYEVGDQYFAVAAVDYHTGESFSSFTEITKDVYSIGTKVEAETYKLAAKVENKDKPSGEGVTVTLYVAEEVKDIAGWKRVDAYTMTRTYTENGTYTVAVKDKAGYEQQVQFTISNIVKETPKEDEPADDTGKKLPFTDVAKGSWYEPYVQYVYEKEIMTGLDKSHFGAEETVCRAQFAVILHRMAGCPKAEYKKLYQDVEDGWFYTDAVIWASGEKAVITGYTSGERKGCFGPSDAITREQMAVMLYRYAKRMGEDVKKGTSQVTGFADYMQVSGYAKEAVAWAVAEGLIQGDQGLLRPQGSTNRAMCAAMIQRFIER